MDSNEDDSGETEVKLSGTNLGRLILLQTLTLAGVLVRVMKKPQPWPVALLQQLLLCRKLLSWLITSTLSVMLLIFRAQSAHLFASFVMHRTAWHKSSAISVPVQNVETC